MIWFILLALTSWYLWFRIVDRRKFALAAHFPGPLNLPLIGSAWMFITAQPEDLVPLINGVCRKYGGIIRVWVGMHKVAFVVTEARIAEIVLGHSHKYLAKSDVYGFLAPWLGNGLLLSTDDKWRSRRKAVTPAFHFKILEDFVEIFDRQSDILVARLGELADDDVFNAYQYVSLLTLDNICEAAMGTKINAQLDTTSTYVQAVHEMSKSVSMRISKVWARHPFLFWLLAGDKKRKQEEAIRVLHSFTSNVIRSRRQQIEGTADVIERSEDGVKKKQALLDILLKSTVDGAPLSESDIQEEVDTFMFEGHDTTTSAICFTLHLLSRHPEVQDKLFEEITDIFGSTSTTITYKQLQDMRYLDCVIKESLRLYPPVPFIGRRLEEETVINARQTIPADCNFSINLMVMFRDPLVFQRPDDFCPERFVNSEMEASAGKTSAYNFCPFSAGTRNCVGQKFAMAEIKCTISKILRHFELVAGGPELLLVNELILRSKSGMHMGLRRRVGFNV